AHKHIERARAAKAPGGGTAPPLPAVDRGLLDGAPSCDGSAAAAPGLRARLRRLVDQAQRRVDALGEGTPGLTNAERMHAVVEAAKEVGPSLFFSLLIVTVSFLPVFAL